ncbi:MAG: thiolase family protein [Leptospirales bacterium]|nr:thiolase family protein [Leptospirales bacterium]
MRFQTSDGDKLVIAGALRTPIGQAGKTLADIESYELGCQVAEALFKKTGLDRSKIDGVVAGEINQSSRAPNVARVMAVKLGLPLESTAATVANNCVSGYEALVDASRRILIGEGSVYLVSGLESMSRIPIYLKGARENSKTATVDKLKANWAEALAAGVDAVDGVEEGLTDPIRNLNMAMTAEVAAQNYGLTKDTLDGYAHQSYKKAYDAIVAGKYRPYQVSVKAGDELLEDDEFIMSKTGMVENPDRFKKASPLFDSKYMSLKQFYDMYGEWIRVKFEEGKSQATTTLFNACPRSDGAGAIILTTEKRAKELGLKPLAALKSWGMYGVDPAYMGIGMAPAMKTAIDRAGMKWTDVKGFEIHEAFAATAMGTMRHVKENWGFDLEQANADGKVNPHGGTLAMGHPLGATGLRVVINQLMHMEHKNVENCIGVICAGGGVGGSVLLEKV